MNSMPSTPASIMRLTALPPPPPTPMTLILASLRASSLKLMRMESVLMFLTCAEFVLLSCSDDAAAIVSDRWRPLGRSVQALDPSAGHESLATDHCLQAPLPTNRAFNFVPQRSSW